MSATAYWPETIPTPLLERSHQLVPRSEATIMESGRRRIRRSHDESIELIKARWNFTVDQFQTFETFVSSELEHGELSFIMETYEPSTLPGHIKQVTRTLAFFEPYTFNRSDNLFAVSATLEVDSEEVEIVAL